MKSRGIPLQYACFTCRKSFKRPQFSAAHSHFMTSAQIDGQRREIKRLEEGRSYPCPQCGGPTYFMGTDFKAPKKSDLKAWKDAAAFIASWKVYYRGSQSNDS